MPSLSALWKVVVPMVTPPGRVAPSSATGTRSPDLLVLSAGDDLQLLPPTSTWQFQRVCLPLSPASPEQVHLHYPADDNAAYALAHVVRALDLGAGHGHGLGELVVVLLFKAHIDELAEPTFLKGSYIKYSLYKR